MLEVSRSIVLCLGFRYAVLDREKKILFAANDIRASEGPKGAYNYCPDQGQPVSWLMPR